MADDPNASSHPKSLADILAEELDGKASDPQTQELPVEEKQPRLRAVYNRIHAEQPERSALCLSGGGIRSAIFSLGIIQGLARHGLMSGFDYLSTVSGGGYVGGWLSAWIKNHPRGLEGVVEELRSRPKLALNPDPEPIRHLRAFSNYLTPRTGLTSVDSWTLIATYLRNIFLNWLVLISWLAAAMMVPRLHLAAITLQPNWATIEPANFQKIVQHWYLGVYGFAIIGFMLVAVAMAYAIVDVPSTGNARLPQSRFLLFRQIPLTLASLALTESWSLYCNVHGCEELQPICAVWGFIVFAVATYVVGGILGSIMLRLPRFRGDKPRVRHPMDSMLRSLAILSTTVFGGFCLWAMATRIFYDPAGNALNYVCFAPPLLLGVLLVVNFLFTGLASWVSNDNDREWWARSAAWILITICGWIVINVVVLWGAQALTPSGDNRLAVFLGGVQANPIAKALLGAFGGMTGIMASLLALRSKLSKALGSSGGAHWLLVVAAVVFFVLLSIVISWLLLIVGSRPWAVNLTHQIWGSDYEYQGQLFLVFSATVVTLLFGMVMGFFINVNTFSLHAMYRDRLVSAFLAASRVQGDRHPHPFTGFDPDDDIRLKDLRGGRPFHVINAALNLVKGRQLAWQERRAESFTISRLHCGSWHLGYRPSPNYGDGISLGTALTISGAAANPNMGYHSSPIVGFLMTLFNVRLGWWLGNPGPPGAYTWQRGGPRYAVAPLFFEATGNTTDSYSYVNLSDGGHFENLGLYEMVLRRCKYILVVDAGQDPDYVFEDLGNAIRKIRIDLGIPIEITVVSPKKSERPINRCAVGTIRYSVVDELGTDGSLIYVKPMLSGDEPPDVLNYAAAHPEFPHESTTDQWFSESQLESYRLLGLHAMDSICGPKWEGQSLPLFFAQVKKDLAVENPAAA